MRYLYVISIYDSTGKLVSYGISALSMSAAVAKAQSMAGVSMQTDPQTTQRLHQIDANA